MAIHTVCPACNANYQLADTMRGKKVRCKSCAESFVVRGKTLAPDRDEDEDEEEDMGRPPLRQRPRKKPSNAAAVPLLIAACIVLAVLVLGVGGVAVWAWARSRQPQAASVPPPDQVPAPPQNQGGLPPWPPAPPPQNPMPARGPLAVQLTNANISGLGARIQVSVDYRFTSGNPQGRRLFLFIKATKAVGMLQNYYVAELRSIGDRMQGTVNAAGMTFGIEHGPFEMWMGEGPAGMMPLMSDRDLQKISNVVTVAGKQPGVPVMGPPPGFPGMRPPIGPRGRRP